MSTGKRLAKRSILGTRIVAPGQDGRFYPATIQAVRSSEADRLARQPARYTVRFDNSRKVSEYLETQLIGPGFSGVARGTQLMAGQRVYLTHVGREMEATVMSHDTVSDQLIVNISVSVLARLSAACVVWAGPDVTTLVKLGCLSSAESGHGGDQGPEISPARYFCELAHYYRARSR